MTADDYQEFPCDLCGATDAIEMPHCREMTNNQVVHICAVCGFVYVKRRRSASRIADAWSNEIFGSDYTAAIPAVTARLTYVAEFLHLEVGLRGKRVCEVGAGEGPFLDIVRQPRYGAEVFGIEPSTANCERMAREGIACFRGTIEDYESQRGSDGSVADVVAILWTLENCHDCRRMLRAAHHILADGGTIAVATGSRILVPFKKSLYDYLGPNPADTHSFRFSANTLQALLTTSGFEVDRVNRYVDQDVLCVIARKSRATGKTWQGDNPLDVYNFFERWYVETKIYYPLQGA